MLPVLIAGGGIGGMTLALALAQHGFRSRILEARSALPTEGAGIQLGPNATRLLQRLGVSDALQKSAVSPDCIIVGDGVAGGELARLPLGKWIARRHHAPYWVVHRASLQNALWSAIRDHPLVSFELGRPVRTISDQTGQPEVTADFGDGGKVSGAILVGADGLWSRVRAHINPSIQLAYTGVAAARALIPRRAVERRFAQNATGVWFAPIAHVVHYPVDGGDTVAIVAIGTCQEQSEGWNIAVDENVIAERFIKMPEAVRDLLGSAQDWRQWALFKPQGPTIWHHGRCVLIGDAAHPILPYLAQGGAMAIEDAVELADVVATAPDDPASVFPAFARKRKARVERVQAASIANGRVYHLDGLAAAARNITLRTVPGQFLMRRYDWIYGYGK
ncbi:MAG: FAD-dependent monooxygenase [Hyphomicrobiaceae bacterium]